MPSARLGEPGMEGTPTSLPKLPTRISGLDEIMEGGLPRERTTLLFGQPGSGKTVLGLEILYRAAMDGEPGILLSFEESPQELRQNAATMGFDLPGLEAEGKLLLLEGRIDHRSIVEGSFGLEPLMAIISGRAREMGAERVMLDALDVLLALMEEPLRVRAELHFLADWLSNSGLTSLMTLKPRQAGAGRAFQDFFYSVSDCVLLLDARVLNQVTTRRLRVLKYRGSDFGRNEYPFIITSCGIRTIPITAFRLLHKPFGERLSCGVERLDGLLGGGFFRGSCVLLAGEPGTGKTLLASSFVEETCRRGERVLYLSFEESEEALVSNVSSAGIDLASPGKEGLLRFLTAMPESKGAEEHLTEVVELVEEFGPRHVVVDAISACQRMGGQQAAFDFLMRLLNFLKGQGITILLVNQTSGSKAQLEISGNGISSMIDTVVFFSYVHGDGETNRAIQVLKSRGSAHSNQLRECVITDQGIKVMEPYSGPGGVLTGTARKLQEAKDAQATRRMEAEIRLREMEVARLEALFEAEKARLKAQIEQAQWDLERLRAERERAHRETAERLSLREEGVRSGIHDAPGD